MPREYQIEDEQVMQVAHYIGTSVTTAFSDPEYQLIKSLIEQAYERLYQATAVN